MVILSGVYILHGGNSHVARGDKLENAVVGVDGVAVALVAVHHLTMLRLHTLAIQVKSQLCHDNRRRAGSLASGQERLAERLLDG